MDGAIHHVIKIEASPITPLKPKHFAVSYSRRLRIFTDDGNSYDITIFADKAEDLKVVEVEELSYLVR